MRVSQGRRGGGSSPLARGLRRVPDPSWVGAGIIPARAGFTRHWRTRSDTWGDHPRSRGVYFWTPLTSTEPPGSSPLARGLRRAARRLRRQRRIIPARAGFTRLVPDVRDASQDHPRSRGVYDHGDQPSSSPAGSSPLARGLQDPRERAHLPDRIIPARAGFTRPTRRPRTGPGDHPRSRGVYRWVSWSWRCWGGSSPLARGLRYRPCGSGPGDRIIPARAGFTACRGGRAAGPWDHPRSRGVYSPIHPPIHTHMGSSPLARGLLGAAGAFRSRGRIIPARAGFTLFTIYCAYSRRDHPRSRGVYGLTEYGFSVTVGSSPLARGLPPPNPHSGLSSRIIPARAGFTSPTSPRTTARVGSSPLARGLQIKSSKRILRHRIIPARAGFTGPRAAPRRRGRDHPRSRGVYCRWSARAAAAMGSSPLARGLPSSPATRRAGIWIIPARAGVTG